MAGSTALEETWASGAAELLWHAMSHLDFESEFDHRIAFVSIDNAVELTLRTYAAMPRRFFGKKDPPLGEGKRPPQNFGQLVEVVERHAGESLAGVDIDKILFFHRVRNRLYHEGIGTPPSKKFTAEYLSIARELLSRLLGYKLPEESPTLAQLRGDVLNAIESEFRSEMKERRASSIAKGLERAMKEGRKVGRERKLLTAAEEAFVAARHLESGWGCERLARELTVQRGAHKLTDPDARLKHTVGPKVVRRILEEKGIYQKGTRKTAKALRTMGAE